MSTELAWVISLLLVAIASGTWELVVWDIQKRKLSLEEKVSHASTYNETRLSTLRLEVDTRISEMQLGVANRASAMHDKLFEAINETKKSSLYSLQSANGSIHSVEDKLTEAIRAHSQLAKLVDDNAGATAQGFTLQARRLELLEQGMKDLGNPKPKREAEAARLMPFGDRK